MTYSSSETEDDLDECESHLSSSSVAADGISFICADIKRTEFSHCAQPREAVPIVSAADHLCSVAEHATSPVTDSILTSTVQEVLNPVQKPNASVAESTVTSALDDFFNLSEQANVSVVDDSHHAQLLRNSPELSASRDDCSVDFWNTDLSAEDWTLPEKIWGVPCELIKTEAAHVSSKNSASDSDVVKIKGYSSKHCKLDITSNVPICSESSVTANKSCFTVHHKIAPRLNTSRQRINQVPRKVFRVLPGHSGTVNRIHWCIPEYSHLLLTASMDATVRVWNVFSSRGCEPCVRTIKVHSKAVKAARWSTCGRQILSCSYDKSAKLTDVECGTIFLLLFKFLSSCTFALEVGNHTNLNFLLSVSYSNYI